MKVKGKGMRIDLEAHEVKYLRIVLEQAKKRITNNKRREQKYEDILYMIGNLEEKIKELNEQDYITIGG